MAHHRNEICHLEVSRFVPIRQAEARIYVAIHQSGVAVRSGFFTFCLVDTSRRSASCTISTATSCTMFASDFPNIRFCECQASEMVPNPLFHLYFDDCWL